MRFEGNVVTSSETVRPSEQAECKFDQIIGSTPALQSVLAQVERVAPTGCS